MRLRARRHEQPTVVAELRDVARYLDYLADGLDDGVSERDAATVARHLSEVVASLESITASLQQVRP